MKMKKFQFQIIETFPYDCNIQLKSQRDAIESSEASRTQTHKLLNYILSNDYFISRSFYYILVLPLPTLPRHGASRSSEVDLLAQLLTVLKNPKFCSIQSYLIELICEHAQKGSLNIYIRPDMRKPTKGQNTNFEKKPIKTKLIKFFKSPPFSLSGE